MADPHPTPTSPRFQDLTGRRFGRLTVIAFAGRRPSHVLWRCRCDCGQETTVQAGGLRSGHTTSCGCFHREQLSARSTTHGQNRPGKRSKEYSAWVGMIVRCTNPKRKVYPYYGGRGIHVCQRWLDSFETFLADVGPAPSPQHQLDRIDNNGHYEPGNVRWATRRQQMRNTRRTRHLTLGSETLTVAEWAERIGIAPNVLRRRVGLGWNDERTLTTPSRTSHLRPQVGRPRRH
jgi:hypothetical protein